MGEVARKKACHSTPFMSTTIRFAVRSAHHRRAQSIPRIDALHRARNDRLDIPLSDGESDITPSALSLESPFLLELCEYM